MAQNISWLGNEYTGVGFVALPKTGGGEARYDDASVTTAEAADVASGKIFLASDGTPTTGTGSGGGGPSYTLTTIVPQQSVTSISPPEDDTDMLLLTSTEGLVEGDYYLVTVNGVVRAQTAVRNNYVLYLADITDAWWNGDRTVLMASGDLYFCPWAAGTYTVKVEHLELNSGGGGSTLIEKTITANGTYNASDDSADGYSKVTVDVPTPSSPWKHILTQDVTVNTTSTQAATAATLQCGAEIATKDKIIWVRIRDKAGPRAGYCYGSDAFFVNYNKANGSTSTFAVPAVLCLRYTTSSAYAGTAGQYGVYGYSISNAGALIVRRRYNSNYSLTINGTYQVDVYTLDLPDGLTLFE